MSQQNVELVRRAMEAWNREDTVFRIREGRLHRMIVYRDRDEALEAAGLRQPRADT